MNCPACKSKQILSHEIDANLKTITCNACHGHWIAHADYLAWLDKQSAVLPENTNVEITLISEEVKTAKLCIDCGTILSRCQVGHGLDFSVDHCGSCGGIWLDHNEWEILKGKNLHDEIHKIFSAPWQNAIRNEKMKKQEAEGKVRAQQDAEAIKNKLKESFRQRFGQETFEKAETIRVWIHEQPEPNALLTFLSDDKPYTL